MVSFSILLLIMVVWLAGAQHQHDFPAIAAAAEAQTVIGLVSKYVVIFGLIHDILPVLPNPKFTLVSVFVYFEF